MSKFKIGDRVRVARMDPFVGVRGSTEWKDLEPTSDPNESLLVSMLTRYDMSHLVGEEGTVTSISFDEDDPQKSIFWLPEMLAVDFDNKDIRYPQ